MRVRDRVSLGIGAAALAFAVLAVGAAPRWAQIGVAILLAAALVPPVFSRRVFDRVSPLIVLPGLALALTLFQLVPLPHAVLAFLDPINDRLRDDGAALVGASPWRAISLDAPATLRAATFFTIVLAAAVLALRFAATERGRYQICASVAGLCAVVAAIVGLHVLFGATRLYGLIDLEQARPAVIGPLLNQNHLGCLMAMGAVMSLGLALHRRQPSAMRVIWLASMAGCAAVTVASTSRGAAVGLVIGIVLTIAIRSNQRSPLAGSRFTTRALPLVIVALTGVLVILYASASGLTSRFEHVTPGEWNRPKSVFQAWKSSAELVEESPWMGIGRGALEPVFTRVHPASTYATYAYVENEYLQAVVDWGIPGAVALGVVFLWFARTALRRWREGALAAGALGTLAAVLVQSNFDFGVELLGVALPATAIAATVAYRPVRETTTHLLVRARALRLVHVAALLGCAALLSSSATTPLLEEHDTLRERGDDVVLEDLRDLLSRHPLDYYGYARAAQLEAGVNDEAALRLLNHALELHPSHAGLHVIAARLLLATGHAEQAAAEYSAALTGSLEPLHVLREIVKALPAALAVSAIPPSSWVYTTDQLVQELASLDRRDIAAAILRDKLDRGYDAQTCQLLFGVAVELKDLDVAKDTARLCKAYQPGRAVRGALAQLFLSRGNATDVLEQLEDVETWDGRIDQKRAAWQIKCDALAQLQRWDDAEHCLHRLQAAGVLDTPRASEVAQRLDEIDQQRAASAGSGSGSASR